MSWGAKKHRRDLPGGGDSYLRFLSKYTTPWGIKNYAYGRYLGRKCPLTVFWWPTMLSFKRKVGSLSTWNKQEG